MRAACSLAALMGLVLIAGCPEPDHGPHRVPSPKPRWVQPPAPTPVKPPPALPPPLTALRGLKGTKILIDPGHGGNDPGAWAGTRSRMSEKSIALDIGRKVAEQLRQRGATVIMSRNSDRYSEPSDRAKMADRNRVNLLVSIHLNSAKRASASGTEVHVYTSAMAASRRAAAAMVSALGRAGIECRGVKPSNLAVLREHSRPAMLIECGFLTNSGDAAKLNTATYRTKMANAIADGIARHVGG